MPAPGFDSDLGYNYQVLGPVPCSASIYCPEAPISSKEFDREQCPKGKNCANPLEATTCESGTWCPLGSIEPIKCHGLSACGKGAGKEVFFAPIVALLLLLAFLTVGSSLFKKHRVRKAARAAEAAQGRDAQQGKGQEGPGSTDPVEPIDLSFQKVSFEVTDPATNKKKVVLSDVSGTLHAGRVTLIMGPSGSGKTTLLNALSGITQPTSGTLRANGAEVTMRGISKIVGFVPQEDVMLTELTVEELLMHSANTRLPSDWSAERRRALVDEAIAMLNLEHRRHATVGDAKSRGISGGERKRVSIGIELVSYPSILFLDEPTSGLDATSSQQVIASLQRIASTKNMTVCAVLHQPRYEIVELCDNIMLLAKGGRTAYFGSVKAAIPFFEGRGFPFPVDDNPADYLLSILGEPGVNHADAWARLAVYPPVLAGAAKGAQAPAKASAAALGKRATDSVVMQFMYYFKRCFVQSGVSIMPIITSIGLQVIVGLAMGLVASDGQRVNPLLPLPEAERCPGIIKDRCMNEYAGQLFMNIWVFFWTMSSGAMSAISGTLAFGLETAAWKREEQAGASHAAYFAAKVVFGMMTMLTDTLGVIGAFYLLGSPRASFGDLFLAFYAMCFSSYGVGYIVAMVMRPANQMVVASVIGVGLSIFSGTYPSISAVNSNGFTKFLWSISHTRWAGAAILTSESRYMDPVTRVDFSWSRLGQNMDGYSIAILYCFLIGLFLRVVAFGLLRIKYVNVRARLFGNSSKGKQSGGGEDVPRSFLVNDAEMTERVTIKSKSSDDGGSPLKHGQQYTYSYSNSSQSLRSSSSDGGYDSTASYSGEEYEDSDAAISTANSTALSGSARSSSDGSVSYFSYDEDDSSMDV